jgi:hypothetical protein
MLSRVTCEESQLMAETKRMSMIGPTLAKTNPWDSQRHESLAKNGSKVVLTLAKNGCWAKEGLGSLGFHWCRCLCRERLCQKMQGAQSVLWAQLDKPSALNGRQ